MGGSCVLSVSGMCLRALWRVLIVLCISAVRLAGLN